MKQHFVTSSDSRYACRLIVMLESLFRHHPEAEVTVLCLDDNLETILRTRSMKRISTVTTQDLISHAPRLSGVRTQRNTWEFYATQKPILLSLLIGRIPENQCLCFVDSDVWFFSSADAVLQEMEGASIGISPHRFSESTAHGIRHGKFNAGFGAWRNDDIGTLCLRDWADDCLDWCHTQADGPRFMNQGYLGRWEERYRHVRVFAHPGANLAPWNLETHRLNYGPTGVEVDGFPLVFFHFSGISRFANGAWHGRNAPGICKSELLRSVYLPYLDALESMESELQPYHDVHASGSVRNFTLESFPVDLRAAAAL